MTDPERPAGTVVPIRERTSVRQVRKDEIVLEERGLYVESWLPERRSRRKPLLMLHGELAGSWVWHRHQEYFAQRGWEGHALNLRAHYWSDVADLSELTVEWYVDDSVAAFDALKRPAVVVGHGLGGLLAMRVTEQRPVAALVLISPALPAALRDPAPPHVLKAVPAIFQRDFIGWQVMPEQLRRLDPDLTIADAMRVQHLMGAESGRARRDVLSGVRVDLAVLGQVPTLVIGGGADRLYPAQDSERLADAIGAEYLAFDGHSHYGVLAGDQSHEQVAEAIRSFLERHKL
jgi:pimeloyl-ACP methyl ester carboxylesterase